MSKHPHAELMLLYAQDAMETERPWERWQERWSDLNGQPGPWVACYEKSMWLRGMDYRRKPRTHKVNGFDVPEPMRSAPGASDFYWVADPAGEDFAFQSTWDGGTIDARRILRGLVHATQEAAVANAKAMLGIAP